MYLCVCAPVCMLGKVTRRPNLTRIVLDLTLSQVPVNVPWDTDMYRFCTSPMTLPQFSDDALFHIRPTLRKYLYDIQR